MSEDNTYLKWGISYAQFRSNPALQALILLRWTGTDTNNGQPVQFTITFTNTTITWDYSGTVMAGDILEYDNTANLVVFKWANHPAYTGKYHKFTWNPEPGATVSIQAYSEEDSQDAAKSSTNAKYSAITLTKQ